ncbi:MAG: pyridoxamine 5'-phosphate oxidase family protein [Proteobacteria bacterium]|nr:pyridoxamine 5'-phosphate oxidase family protein [Pseudomonadota bacterium]
MLTRLKKTIGHKLLDRFKQGKQAAFDPSLDHCLISIRAMLKASKYCFLISHSNRDWPSARMVQPIVDLDTMDIWLGTNPNLRKVKEIETNPHVTLAFGSDRENANLIIYGKAFILKDKEVRKKHWMGSWVLFFPGGPASEDFVSIKVEAQEIEIMNFKRNLVDEPFGLKPVRLVQDDIGWQVK